MSKRQILSAVVCGMALAVTGCDSDSTASGGTAGSGGTGGAGGAVDTSGACGVVCEGGQYDCVIDGFDPSDGLEACTRDCQASWTNEQDAECVGEADFVISCVDANGSCDSLDVATCGTAQDDLILCASGT